MVMTDDDIRAAMGAGELGIEEFDEASLQGASYDARVGNRAILGGTDSEVDIAARGSVTIRPGEFVLLLTREKFTLSPSLTGHLGTRSYYTRKGLMVLAGLQIDAGFEGHLVIGGYNAAPRRLTLDYESPFLTVEFHRLAHPVSKAYASGDEQREGRIPRIDKDYLRTLETQSLSNVSADLRALTQNVGAMQTQLKYFYAPLMVGTFMAVVGFGLAALLQ